MAGLCCLAGAWARVPLGSPAFHKKCQSVMCVSSPCRVSPRSAAVSCASRGRIPAGAVERIRTRIDRSAIDRTGQVHTSRSQCERAGEIERAIEFKSRVSIVESDRALANVFRRRDNDRIGPRFCNRRRCRRTVRHAAAPIRGIGPVAIGGDIPGACGQVRPPSVEFVERQVGP